MDVQITLFPGGGSLAFQDIQHRGSFQHRAVALFLLWQDATRGQPIAQADFFACHICSKIRSAEYFSNAMMKGRRGKLSNVPSKERNSRFCIPCGMRSDRYIPGVYIQYGGMTWGRWNRLLQMPRVQTVVVDICFICPRRKNLCCLYAIAKLLI